MTYDVVIVFLVWRCLLGGLANSQPLALERAFVRCGFLLVGPRRSIHEILILFNPGDIEWNSIASVIELTLLAIIMRVG